MLFCVYAFMSLFWVSVLSISIRLFEISISTCCMLHQNVVFLFFVNGVLIIERIRGLLHV